MNSFEEWFLDKFGWIPAPESNAAIVKVYRDHEAAYRAGMLRAAEILDNKAKVMRKYTYEYGAVAALERTAEDICKEARK